MIPNKETNKKGNNENASQESIASFSLFDAGLFIQKLIRNWYWFVFMFGVGYVIAYVYSRYFTQRIYESNLSLSMSSNATSYFTPNQSINFIWDQRSNSDGLFLKKMILSRSHNEYLVKKLDLFINYSTKGVIKETYLDKYDSPVFIEIDRDYPQQINFPITLLPKGNDQYEVTFPEEGFSNYLYDYKNETFVSVPEYPIPKNKLIKVGQWYTAPNFKFKLVKNPVTPAIGVDNIIIKLSSVNAAVQSIIATTSVKFDEELNSVIIISKRGYNLNGTVQFLNTTVEELIKKRLEDRNTVDQNTVKYLTVNLERVKKQLDSAATKLNDIKLKEGIFNLEEGDTRIWGSITDLEKKKVDIQDKIKTLNNIKRTLMSSSLDNLISLRSAGIDDSSFSTTVSELKLLYIKKREMESIYTPQSEAMKEINRQINDIKLGSQANLQSYYDDFYKELNEINQKISQAENSLVNLPEGQRRYFDVKRGYDIIENTYSLLLTKQAESKMRVATNRSDLNIIDPAKNLDQGPVAPNISNIKNIIIGVLLLIPLLIIVLRTLLDNRVINIKEVLRVTKIPLLGVIGKSSHENNLTVLEQPKSSVSEAFRGLRANLRFLAGEDGRAKVILVTSSISGEGKTYTAINIASVLGLSGKKTILLGMDLRKPKIFGDFKIDNRYGLSNYLTGEVGMGDIINKTEISSLDVITSGPIPPNPSELLMSQKNIDFIQGLREHYDFIIIDSPPVGLVADSFELMKYTDANIYVVRHEYTEKYMLKMITEKYAKHEIQHLGLVYNDYQVKQGYGYGYGYGYFDEDANYKEPTLIRLRNKIKSILRK